MLKCQNLFHEDFDISILEGVYCMMKARFYLLLIFIVSISGCQQQTEPKQADDIQPKVEVKRKEKEKELIMNMPEINQDIIELPIEMKDGTQLFSVDKLFQHIDGFYVYDEINKTLKMEIEGRSFMLIYGVPVLQENTFYHANDELFFTLIEDKPYLPVAFLTDILNQDIEKGDGLITFAWDKDKSQTNHDVVRSFDQIQSVEDVISILSQLQSPIKGATVDKIRSHLPGARRAYRNGFHEGMDWYGYSSGVTIDRSTPIYAMAKGEVIRADHHYSGYSSIQERNEDLALAKSLEKTPIYMLDKLRGQQVWIQYENGVMARFAHMNSIEENITVGSQVDATTVIGYIGNSGTSGEVKKDNSELHLHLDLLINGELFWKNLTQSEVVQVLEAIFESKKSSKTNKK